MQFGQLLEVVMVLVGKGNVASVQDSFVTDRALEVSARFNQHVIENSVNASAVRSLANPVTGGGFHVQPGHLQMLRARRDGLDRPEQWAEILSNNLVANGAGIVKPGGGLMSAEESLQALTNETLSFAEKQLPGLQALKVVA